MFIMGTFWKFSLLLLHIFLFFSQNIYYPMFFSSFHRRIPFWEKRDITSWVLYITRFVHFSTTMTHNQFNNYVSDHVLVYIYILMRVTWLRIFRTLPHVGVGVTDLSVAIATDQSVKFGTGRIAHDRCLEECSMYCGCVHDEWFGYVTWF